MCETCNRAIAAAPWHRHTRLMVEQCARREAMQRARKAAPVPMPEVREVYDQDAIWLTVTGLLMIGILIAFAWVVLP